MDRNNMIVLEVKEVEDALGELQYSPQAVNKIIEMLEEQNLRMGRERMPIKTPTSQFLGQPAGCDYKNCKKWVEGNCATGCSGFLQDN